MRVSIPLPTACEAVALPCELIPLDIYTDTCVPSTHQHIHFTTLNSTIHPYNTPNTYTPHCDINKHFEYDNPCIRTPLYRFLQVHKYSKIAFFDAPLRPQRLSFTTSFLPHILRIYWLSSVPINRVVPHSGRIVTTTSTLGRVPATNFTKRAFWKILCTLYCDFFIVTH